MAKPGFGIWRRKEATALSWPRTESKTALELAKDRAKPFPKTFPFPKDRIVFWEKKSPRGRLIRPKILKDPRSKIKRRWFRAKWANLSISRLQLVHLPHEQIQAQIQDFEEKKAKAIWKDAKGAK